MYKVSCYFNNLIILYTIVFIFSILSHRKPHTSQTGGTLQRAIKKFTGFNVAHFMSTRAICIYEI